MDVLPVLNQAAGGSKHSLLLTQERAECDLQVHLEAEFGAGEKGDCAPKGKSWFTLSTQLSTMKILAQSSSPQWHRDQNETKSKTRELRTV